MSMRSAVRKKKKRVASGSPIQKALNIARSVSSENKGRVKSVKLKIKFKE